MPDPTPEAIALIEKLTAKWLSENPNASTVDALRYAAGLQDGVNAALAHRDPSKVTLSRETVDAVRRVLKLTRTVLDAQKQSGGIVYLSDKIAKVTTQLEKEIGE